MRRCYGCGKQYLRVNIVDVWTLRMPGKRFGWLKQKVKLCNACCSQRQAHQMMSITHVVVPKEGK